MKYLAIYSGGKAYEIKDSENLLNRIFLTDIQINDDVVEKITEEKVKGNIVTIKNINTTGTITNFDDVFESIVNN